MDAEAPDSLAHVEALVAICVVVGLLQAGLLHDRHDRAVLLPDFLDVVSQSVTLEVMFVPSSNLG